MTNIEECIFFPLCMSKVPRLKMLSFWQGNHQLWGQNWMQYYLLKGHFRQECNLPRFHTRFSPSPKTLLESEVCFFRWVKCWHMIHNGMIWDVYWCVTTVQVFTLFRQRVGNVKVIVIEVQQLHCSFQRILGLIYLLRYGVHWDLAQKNKDKLEERK